MPTRFPRGMTGAALALLLPVSVANAQTTLPAGASTLRVTVLDPSGAVIPGARVTVSAGADATVSLTTDERGEAALHRLAPGRYVVRAEFEGFEPVEIPDLRVRGRETRRELRLPIARVADEVTVARDPREVRTDPRGDAFSTVLTADQIDQLPDDPEELEEALSQMAGPGSVLRVNGFRGGRLPPKSQIQEIRFRRNLFAAENHEPAHISVDIRTRPGVSAFRGSLDLGFRDESLNARNAFAPRKGDEQQRRALLSLEGPLWKNRTSFAFTTDGLDSFDSKTVVAALVDGAFSDVVRRPTDRMNFNARVEHALSKTHALRVEVQRGETDNRNLGVGDFDLAERAYDREVNSRLFRVSESGPVGKSLFNEARFQVNWTNTLSTPLVATPAVQVLNAFSAGGAQISGGRDAREVEIVDNVDINSGRHAMRAGFLFEAGRYRSDESRNSNGVFTFASLHAYEAARPTTYSVRVGSPLVEYSHYELGWYVQDDIRARKDLTLSVGLRHEVQAHLDDRDNFSPRAGFIWSPFRSGHTTIRGGVGLFYDWFGADTYEQTLRVDGVTQQDIVVRDPGYPDPFAGGAVIVLPAGRIQAAPDLRMPTVLQGAIGVERRLAASTTLNVMYFETRGWNELRGRNINAPANGIRPDAAAGNITQIESTAESSRRSLSFNLNLNVPSRRIFLASNYTIAWWRNEADGPLSLPADNYDLDGEWGPAPGDVRHRLAGMFSMPVWRDLRVSSMFRVSSGAPYTIITGFDDNGDTVSNDRPEGVGRNNARGTVQWDISARLQYSFGFGERAQQGGPAGAPVIHVVRAGDEPPMGGMMMGGATNKRFRLDLYAGVSNLFNAVNYVSFSGVMTSPFFGRAVAAQPGRRMEVGARLGF
ncbi:MAG TPA: TonB-dependent receptor [Vicinamibacterales bacterium]|nr:TonB-dependent receptor [Vicinamibacterales bacterium]